MADIRIAPATSLDKNTLLALLRRVVARAREGSKARRRTCSSLGALSDRMLRDIGLTRNDIYRLSGDPNLVDPELARIVRRRGRNW